MNFPFVRLKRERRPFHFKRKSMSSFLESEFQQKRASTQIFIAPETPYRASVTAALSNLDMPTSSIPGLVEVRCQTQQEVSEPDNYGFIQVRTKLTCAVFNDDQSLYEQTVVGKASSRDEQKARAQSENALEDALKPLVDKVDALWSI